MPYSNVEQITPIMNEVLRVRPRNLIDVGCGLGVYGLLSRIQLDMYFDEKFYTKLFRKYRPEKVEWETTIDAIEGFQDYLDYIPGWVYNNIIVEDVRVALPKISDSKYDLALALAIIEHLTKEEGIEFVRELKRISRVVIISVPKKVEPQSVPDNEFETHRSTWSKEDFINLGFNRFLSHSGAWIPVCDPSLPPYDGSDDNSLLKISNIPDTNVQDRVGYKLDILSEKLDKVIELQNSALYGLSIKYRIKSILRKLGLHRY